MPTFRSFAVPSTGRAPGSTIGMDAPDTRRIRVRDVERHPPQGPGPGPLRADTVMARSQADLPSIRAMASSAPYACRYGSQRGSLCPVPMIRHASPEGGAG